MSGLCFCGESQSSSVWSSSATRLRNVRSPWWMLLRGSIVFAQLDPRLHRLPKFLFSRRHPRVDQIILSGTYPNPAVAICHASTGEYTLSDSKYGDFPFHGVPLVIIHIYSIFHFGGTKKSYYFRRYHPYDIPHPWFSTYIFSIVNQSFNGLFIHVYRIFHYKRTILGVPPKPVGPVGGAWGAPTLSPRLGALLGAGAASVPLGSKMGVSIAMGGPTHGWFTREISIEMDY